MSRTSSESGTQRAAEHSRALRQERAARGFRTTFWSLVVGLTAFAALFLTLGALQGPKLSTAQVDTVRVTEQAGQQLRLFANQPLSDVDPDQITVTPAAPFTVTVQSDLIIVQFGQPLRFATEYTVQVADVEAPARESRSTFEHRFTTAPGDLLYLSRGETSDQILRLDVIGTGPGEVVHEAPGIQRFAPVENAIVLARDAPGNTSTVEVVDPASGVTEQIRLPDGTRVDALVAPPTGTTVALILTSVDPDAEGALVQALALVDLAATGTVDLVTGIDGEPLSTASVHFTAAGDELLVHALDQTLLSFPVADPALQLPLGQFTEVYGLSSEGGRLSASDPFGGVAVDLTSGDEERINPSLFEGLLAFGGEFQLTAGETWVQRVALTDENGEAFANLIVADDGTGASRLVARTIDDRGSLGAFELSPNDQYVAIEVTPVVADAEPDGRPVTPQARSVTLAIVDLESGELVRTVAGFAPAW